MLKQWSCRWSVSAITEVNLILILVTHVVTGGLFPETEMNEADEKVDEDGAAGACVMGWTRGSGGFLHRGTPCHPPTAPVVHVCHCHFCWAFTHVGDFDIPVACCLATCAQPRWVAQSWQGVSWYVRSDLCDYTLTCCLPNWHSPERSANHAFSKTSLLVLGKPVVWQL